MENQKLRIIRSDRRTSSLEVAGSEIIVRVPMHYTDEMARNLAERNRSWIEKQLVKMEKADEIQKSLPPLSAEEIRALAQKALGYIPERVRYYAPIIGVTYGNVTIRNQKTKWGSCSSKGNLNFNCLLMLMPPEVTDAVIVHELCHRKQPNHSDRFYREVLRVYPEYPKCEKWLKENGGAIMRRMTDGIEKE